MTLGVEVGERHGRRTIVDARITRVSSTAFVLAQCDCGHRTQVNLSQLRSGRGVACLACSRKGKA